MITQETAGKVLKGVYAAALAFLTGLSTMLVGNEPFSDITSGQWVLLCAWTLAAFGSVWGLAGWAGPNINSGSSSEK